MPLWLWLLLGGAAAVAVVGGTRTIDEATITAVTKHAMVAETDVAVLRKLQDLLSHSGRFDLAGVVKARADGIEQGRIVTVASVAQSGAGTGPIDSPTLTLKQATQQTLVQQALPMQSNLANVMSKV